MIITPIFSVHIWKVVAYNQSDIDTSLFHTAAAAKSLQSCPTLCDPIDGSPPGSAIPGILQARVLEWVAISFSNVWKWKMKVKSLSHVQLSVTPWTAAYQAPPSLGFSRQEYWSGVPLPSPLFPTTEFKFNRGFYSKATNKNSPSWHYHSCILTSTEERKETYLCLNFDHAIA